MKVIELLEEGLSQDRAKGLIKEFLKFAQKSLELPSLPKITLHTNSKRSVENRSFGGYGGHSINVTIKDRHIQDVLRTLAHELVHYRQDLRDELNNESGNDGSPEENEANAEAAVILRKWGKLHPEFFKYSAIE